jgi:hypothetical protein
LGFNLGRGIFGLLKRRSKVAEQQPETESGADSDFSSLSRRYLCWIQAWDLVAENSPGKGSVLATLIRNQKDFACGVTLLGF